MTHRNRWFTELNSMVIFNSYVTNYQRVLFNVMQVGDRNHKKIPFNHMFSLKTNAHFVQDSSSKVFASEWKKCSRSPAEKIRHPQGITDGGADASSYNSQIKAGYNRNMVYRIAVLVLSVF